MATGTNQDAISRLAAVTLGTGLTDILDFATISRAPNSIAQIFSIWITNTDTVGHFFTLRAGPSGSLATPLPYSRGELVAIQPNQLIIIDSSGGTPVMVLKQGDKLQGLCDAASKVNVAIDGSLLAN